MVRRAYDRMGNLGSRALHFHPADVEFGLEDLEVEFVVVLDGEISGLLAGVTMMRDAPLRCRALCA